MQAADEDIVFVEAPKRSKRSSFAVARFAEGDRTKEAAAGKSPFLTFRIVLSPACTTLAAL